MTRVPRLPLAAALTANVALAASLLHGPQALGPWASFSNTWWPVSLTLLVAFALCARAVIQRATAMIADGDGRLLLLPILFGSAAVVLWVPQVQAHREYVAGPAFMGVGAWLLIVAALGRPTVSAIRSSAPWQTLASGATNADRARDTLALAGPVLTGVALLLFASMLGAPTSPVSVARVAFEGVGWGSALIALVLIVLAGRIMVTYRPATAQPRRAVAADTAVAAHLHDSVLQELALIRRNADDPELVRATARTAERGLRDWLSGHDPAVEGTLRAALTQVARRIEDEQPGGTIEVVTVRDVPLDDHHRALVDAAQEALRNAISHGGGIVRLFAEVGDDGAVAVYVRDTGPGFDVGAVPNERRGVRDAIIGRMQAAGGTAEIDSTPEGTEVTLRLPPGTAP